MPTCSPRLFFAVCALLALSAPIAMAHTPTWQGPYLGGYLGGGFGMNDVSTHVDAVSSTAYFSSSAEANAVADAGTWTSNPNNVIAGVQFGHDWVWKHMVYGVVIDYGALPLESSTHGGSTFLKTSMNTDWLFTLRPRLGYRLSWYRPTLIYLTGGMAMANVEVANNYNDASPYAGKGKNDTSANQIGWTVGLGIEIAAYQYVSFGLEYLYLQLPSLEAEALVSNTAGGFGIPPHSLNSTLSTTGKFSANLLKFVVNYRMIE